MSLEKEKDQLKETVNNISGAYIWLAFGFLLVFSLICFWAIKIAIWLVGFFS